jgi:hypothetical protein
MICTSTKMKLHWLARHFRYEKLKEGMKEKAILSRGKLSFNPIREMLQKNQDLVY